MSGLVRSSIRSLLLGVLLAPAAAQSQEVPGDRRPPEPASLTVEGFGVERIADAERTTVERRYHELQQFVASA